MRADPLPVVLLLLAAAAGGGQEELPGGVLGAAAALTEEDSAELAPVEAGSRVRAAPSWDAPTLAVTDVPLDLEVLDRRHGWIEVRYASFRGWIATSEAAPLVPAPAAAPPPVVERFAPDPDEARLERAKAILGQDAPLALGPFDLYTDLPPGPFLGRLHAVAAGLAAAYDERYRLRRPQLGGQAVLLFATEEGYRDYERGEGELADLDVAGHATRNLAALFVAERDTETTGAVLVHELTHLLNRRTMRHRPPAWLEEGMANDLAYCAIQPDGGLDLGSLGGRAQVFVEAGRRGSLARIHLEGPAASLNVVQREAARGRLQPLTTLLDLGWGEFVLPERRQLNYAQSAFFIRYLLDGERGRLAPGFRAYLGQVAEGGAADLAALLGHLDRDPRRLDRGFTGWLRFSAGL